jgi:hypothetical protein
VDGLEGDVMDPRFLKWLGDALIHYSNNIQAMEKVMAFSGADKTFISKMSELVPTLTPMPLSSEKMDEFYREWLVFFDAVPRKDHEALKGKVMALEKECEQLRGTLDNLVQGLAGLKYFPEAMNPWLELARKAMAAHMEWLEDFRKTPGGSGQK